MNCFLYYLPGATGGIATHRQMKAAGLGYAFPLEGGECPAPAWGAPGPDGRQGLLVTYGDDPRHSNPALTYDPQTQVWVQLPAPDGATSAAAPWLGYAKDPLQRPMAGDLLRKRTAVDSHSVELGDGGNWSIPIVRRFPDGTALPQVLVAGSNGRVTPRVRKDFEELYNFALLLTEDLFGSGATDFAALPEDKRNAAYMRFGVLALGVNYRVSFAEVSALELLDTQNIKRVAQAIIDWPNLQKFLEEFKKKHHAAPSPGPIS
jgi:hypothetical protein